MWISANCTTTKPCLIPADVNTAENTENVGKLNQEHFFLQIIITAVVCFQDNGVTCHHQMEFR